MDKQNLLLQTIAASTNTTPDPAAHTLYPNLAAEIVATGYSLYTFAEHGDITVSLLVSALTEGATLHCAELYGMTRLICERRERLSLVNYLVVPSLSIVDPGTAKGKHRMYALISEAHITSDKIKEYPYWNKCDDVYYGIQLYRAANTIKRLCDGSCVSYADYGRTFISFENMLSHYRCVHGIKRSY